MHRHAKGGHGNSAQDCRTVLQRCAAWHDVRISGGSGLRRTTSAARALKPSTPCKGNGLHIGAHPRASGCFSGRPQHISPENLGELCVHCGELAVLCGPSHVPDAACSSQRLLRVATRPLAQRALVDQHQTVLLKQAWDESDEMYGYRKLHDDLCDMGDGIRPNRTWRLAHRAGIRAQIG